MIRQTTINETIQIIVIAFAILLLILFQFGLLTPSQTTASGIQTSANDTMDDELEIQTALNDPDELSLFGSHR